jgi:hypothetical protein
VFSLADRGLCRGWSSKPYVQHLVQVSRVACGWDGVHIAQVLALVFNEQPVVLLHKQRALCICNRIIDYQPECWPMLWSLSGVGQRNADADVPKQVHAKVAARLSQHVASALLTSSTPWWLCCCNDVSCTTEVDLHTTA